MNNRVILATLAGAIIAFFGGWVIFDMILDTYFAKELTEAGAAVIRPETEIKVWALAISNLLYSFLLTVIYYVWANINTIRSGAVAGALISALVTMSQGLMYYSYLDITVDFRGTVIDTVASAILGALVGGVIGWVLGYNRE